MEHMNAGISGNLGLTQVLEGLQDTDGFQKVLGNRRCRILVPWTKTFGSAVVLAFLFIELSLLFGGGILVLLVLRNQVIHVGLSLCELHLVHAWGYIRLHLS